LIIHSAILKENNVRHFRHHESKVYVRSQSLTYPEEIPSLKADLIESRVIRKKIMFDKRRYEETSQKRPSCNDHKRR